MDGFNLYEYVRGNPLLFLDPFGLVTGVEEVGTAVAADALLKSVGLRTAGGVILVNTSKTPVGRTAIGSFFVGVLAGLAINEFTSLDEMIAQRVVGSADLPGFTEGELRALRQIREARNKASKELDCPQTATGGSGQKPPNQPPAALGAGGELPENPNDLLRDGWEETTHSAQARNSNSREFTNPRTGEKVRFDRGEPGKPGFRGQDHYHRTNPNATGRHDQFLDIHGNPVPRGSEASHIPPG